MRGHILVFRSSKRRICCIKHLFFLLFIFCFAETHAKTLSKHEIDSIIPLLPTLKGDTSKVKLYFKLINNYFDIDNDSALILGLPAIRLADSLNWEKGLYDLKSIVGRIYWRMGKFDTALNYHFEALKYYQSINDTSNIAAMISAIGQDYADGGKYQEALKYFQQAEKIYELAGDIEAVASTYLFCSFIYFSQGNYSESIKIDYKALKLYEQTGNTYGAAIARGNIADSYIGLGNYEEALKCYMESAAAMAANKDIINLTGNYISIGNVYKSMGKYKDAIKYLIIANGKAKEIRNDYLMAFSKTSLGEVYMKQADYREALPHFLEGVTLYRKVSNHLELAVALSKTGICQTRLGNYAEARKSFGEAYALSTDLESKIPLAEYYKGVEMLDSAMGDWQNAYIHHKKYSIIQDSLISLKGEKKILEQKFQYDTEKKEVMAKAAQEKKDIRQRTIRNSIAASLAGTLIFLVVTYRQRNKISRARKRSDELLLNILPAEVAEELKAKGSADPKMIDLATVLFTDFKNFTQISEKFSPGELVAEINECFSAFDNIMQKFGVEKIKTIGDAYMAAGGIPTPNSTHAKDVVGAALAIQKFMYDLKQKKQAENKLFFEIRIGIHTGPIVAGIVGVKKFAYDIWGDTVNIASRMESSGEAGKVNISESTYELVKDKFICTHRGKIQAKNKGEIDMYFVESIL